MTAFWAWFKGVVHTQGWIVELVLIVLLTTIIFFLARLTLRRLQKRLSHADHLWCQSLIDAAYRPLGVLVWVGGAIFAFETLTERLASVRTIEICRVIQNLAILTIFLWFLLSFISTIERHLMSGRRKKGQEARIDKTALHGLAQVARTFVVVAGCLIALSIFGIPLSAVVAFGGFGGLAVGFAAKDLLANFFGGLIVILDRPFSVGDWIRSPDKQIEGTVEHIGWRLTRILTPERSPLYVPNSLFSTIALENPSRMLNRRIYSKIGLRYDDAAKMEAILADIDAMLRAHPEIDTELTILVNFVEFGPSSLNFLIFAFTKTTQWVKFQAVQQDVFFKVMKIIEQHGAQCAYPTTTLHITYDDANAVPAQNTDSQK